MGRFKVRKSAAQRRLELRDAMFRGAAKVIWNRHDNDGYTTVPRTIALVMTLINLLDEKMDASRVYAELWSRVADEGFIEMVDEGEHAYAAGYVTPRAARTWGERMRVLESLGFIKAAPKGPWKYGYVLILHPHDVVETLLDRRDDIPEAWRNLYLQRLAQIGARRGRAVAKAKKPASVRRRRAGAPAH